MKRYVFFWDVGLCGMGGADTALEFPDDVSEQELEDHAWQIACEAASTYGYSPECDRPWTDDEDEDEEDSYREIDAWYEEYDADKHDMLKPGGGTWF